ncbi:unnamed protein product [Ceratitis capitata]|uniref:(Mediterranean fruit fly) hypothetical protein n=1 Tax=Ceratitis capitata TaxID=7213 RepID=A0A811U3R1_CERCA|nr:unnamed protein product [Ceratitis capitata]
MYEALLKYCQQIEVLKLSCPKFSYACLASLPRLRELFLVDGAPKGATKLCLYQQLAHRPRQFEVLNIRSNSSLTAEHLTLISQLQSLRELTLSHNLVVNNDGLAKLCKLRNLEVLGIKGCMCISAKGLLKLLQHCTKLHQLNIIFIRNITCKFVLDSIPILWRTYNERKRKFVLLAFNTNIQEKSLRDEVQYLEAVEKSLIEVRDVLNPADLYGGPYYNYSRIGPCINNYEDDLYSTDEEENVAFLLANMSGKSFI